MMRVASKGRAGIALGLMGIVLVSLSLLNVQPAYQTIQEQDIRRFVELSQASGKYTILVFGPAGTEGVEPGMKAFLVAYQAKVRELVRQSEGIAQVLWVQPTGGSEILYQTTERYGIYTIPSLVVLTPSGDIGNKFVGMFNVDEVLGALQIATSF